MSNLSLIKDVKDATAQLLGGVRDFLNLGNGRTITDINKTARENELTLYALASENISPQVYSRLANGVEVQVAAAIHAILNTAIVNDPAAAMDFIKNNFTNNSDLTNQLKDGIRGISDSLSEGIDLDVVLGDFKLDLNEAAAPRLDSKTHTTKYSDKKPANPVVRDIRKDQRVMVGNERIGGTTGKTLTRGSNQAVFGGENDLRIQDGHAIRLPGHLHRISINYINNQGTAIPLVLNIFIRVRLIPTPATALLEAMASAKNRSNFFTYLRWRAGASSFFKGFLVNIKEIEKQIKRDTSKSLTERILGSLLSKSGFTRPRAFGDSTELKNFTLMITADDADRLYREYDLNLTKPGALRTVFNNMNIMSLMIVDEAKARVTIFESDAPTEMSVVTINDLNNSEQLARLFQNVNR